MNRKEIFEQLCNEYALDYTKVPSERGIILSSGDSEVKLTKEHIDEMFQFDEYLEMSHDEFIDTSDALNKSEITVPSLKNINLYFYDENFDLAA